MRKTGFLACFSLISAVILCQNVARPTPQKASQQPPLQYEVSVTLKLIQVYVTDKSGSPVKDVTKDDFVVFDNGKPVTITDFEKHDLAPLSPEAAAQPVDAKPDTALSVETKPASAPASPQTVPRKFILLFDFAFNTPRGVAAAIKAASHFLDTDVGPGDESALLSFSMLKGLKIHEFLTTDHAKVKKAISGINAKDAAGRADEIEQAYWRMVEIVQSESSATGGNSTAKEELQRMEMQRQDSALQARNYFLGLTALAHALRLVQGQKNVLFFSNGIPSSLVNATRSVGISTYRAGTEPGATRGGMSTGSTFEIGNSVLRPLQEAMLKEFSASNCSFYAFDTRESAKIPSLFAYDEMQFMTRAGGGMKSADGASLSITSPFRDDKTTGMDSLKSLSKQTGGKYYSNIGFYEKNLNEVSSVTATYYVLGYSISAAADGKFHDVKVEVKRQGVQVRAQRGYFNPKPFREYTDLEKNVHLFDLALNERSELQTPKIVPISALSYDAGLGSRVRALARIPKEAWDEFGGSSAEFVALFFDEQDNLLSLQRAAGSIADYRGKEIIFTAGAPAPPGLAKCRVVVRDLETGRSAVASAQIFIRESGGKGLAVYSPLLVIKGGEVFNLEGVVKGTPESPSWREIYSYDSSGFSPVIGEETIGAGKVEVIVPYAASVVGRADIAFKANLVNSKSGENVPVPLELRELTRRGAVEVQKLELSLDAVSPGSYLLYIYVGDKVSGASASTHIPLTIGP